MYDFFILGQVPGTTFIVTFLMWVEIAALLTTLLVWMTYRRHLAVARYVKPTISNEPGSLQLSTAQ